VPVRAVSGSEVCFEPEELPAEGRPMIVVAMEGAQLEQFVEANNLKDVTWAHLTVHGVIVGYANGRSELLQSGQPVACRTWPLKKKYRS
jgi:hypothetical protein